MQINCVIFLPDKTFLGKEPAFPVFPTVILKPSTSGYFDEELFNILPNDKFLDWSKLEAFADDKINVI